MTQDPMAVAAEIARENDLSKTRNETTLYMLVEGKIGKPTHGPVSSNYTLWTETVRHVLKLWHTARGTTP